MNRASTDYPVPQLANLPKASAGEARSRLDVIATVSSESLLGERGELKILHNGEQYSLRRTRHGRLILTK